MWTHTDENGKKREFAGSQNVWIKRLGFFILVIGLFPSLLIKYGDQIEFVGKFIIGAIVVSYVIYHIRGFLKSIFNPEK